MMEKNRQSAIASTTEQKLQGLAKPSPNPNENKQENSTSDIIEIVDSLP